MLLLGSCLVPFLLLSLSLTPAAVRAQRSPQEAFMIQYFERRLAQMEERLAQCERSTAGVTQKMYDLSSQLRGQLSTVDVLRAEVGQQMAGVSMRLHRVERDVEYLERKLPSGTDVEVDAGLLEQQLREAEDEERRRKARVTVPNDCSLALAEVKSLKMVRKAGDAYGSWFKDPSKGSAKVYLFSGYRNRTVLEYVSLKTFTQRNTSKPAKAIELPFHWQGTGHVIYNGFLYYHKAETTNQILKVSLENRTVVDSMMLPGAGHLPAYGLNPNTYLDLAVDELGLWAIHADTEYGGNLVISRLEPGSLAVEHTWDTGCHSGDSEDAFLLCGTLYVVTNTHHGGRPTIRCLFDIHDTIRSEQSPVLFFPKRYTTHASMHYHPKDKTLYAWDDGYLTMYRLETRTKEQLLPS